MHQYADRHRLSCEDIESCVGNEEDWYQWDHVVQAVSDFQPVDAESGFEEMEERGCEGIDVNLFAMSNVKQKADELSRRLRHHNLFILQCSACS